MYIYMLEVQAFEENYSFSVYILGVYIIVVQNACWCAVSVQYEENPQFLLLLIEWIKYGWVRDMIRNVKKSWWEVKMGVSCRSLNVSKHKQWNFYHPSWSSSHLHKKRKQNFNLCLGSRKSLLLGYWWCWFWGRSDWTSHLIYYCFFRDALALGCCT